MKKFIHNLKTKIGNIKWWKVLIVGLPPLIISWPLIGGFLPFPFKVYLRPGPVDPINVSNKPEKVSIQGATDSIGSKPLFSLLLKTKIASMPVDLCLDNKNEIFDGDKPVDPHTLMDAEEAGAMNIKFHNLNDGLSDEIYTKLGEKNCKVLSIEGAALENSEVRNPLPLKLKASMQGNKLTVNLEPKNYTIRIFNTLGYYQIKWQWSIFFTNLIISIFAWWIFLSSWFSIWKYIYPNRGKIKSK